MPPAEYIALFIPFVISVIGAGVAIYSRHKLGTETIHRLQQQKTEIEIKLQQQKVETEQTLIERGAAVFERYARDLGAAYNAERDRREKLDVEVARLQRLITALEFRIEELNFQLSRLTGVPPRAMPVIPEPAPPSNEPFPPPTDTEKIEEVVGPLPKLENLNG